MPRPLPVWVTDLTVRVALDESRFDVPDISWRIKRSTEPSSSGRYYRHTNRLVVSAGWDEVDQKLVLLHELGHWLAEPYDHHNANFWIIAFRLFRRYGIDMEYAQQRSLRYRKNAIAGIRADALSAAEPNPAPGPERCPVCGTPLTGFFCSCPTCSVSMHVACLAVHLPKHQGER